jgi:hypothetical protein
MAHRFQAWIRRSKALAAYERLCEARPWSTGFAVCAVKASISDAIAQKVVVSDLCVVEYAEER